jgi:hypothetical protein
LSNLHNAMIAQSCHYVIRVKKSTPPTAEKENMQ